MTSSSIAEHGAVFGEVARRRPAEGCVEIAFAVAPDGRTYIDRQRALYPFHLCRALSVPGDPAGLATLYLQSCSGGIYEADRHRIRLRGAAGSQAHVTTQAATIVHRMEREGALQEVVLEADEGALLEYLPDPLILFAGARLDTRLRLRAHRSARVIVADSFICHDPAGGAALFDRLRGRIDVEDWNGHLLACDRFSLVGETLRAWRPGIAAGFHAQASLWLVAGDLGCQELLENLRGVLAGAVNVYAGTSRLPGDCGVLVRLMAVDGAGLRAATVAAWQEMRRALTGMKPQPRRK